MIGPNEISVALVLMKRAPLEGHEAKAAAVAIDKFEKMLAAMQQNTEEENGDNADPAEQST